MDRFRVLLWTGWSIQAVSPLVPVLAAAIHRRSGGYESPSWLGRLTVLLAFNLAANWAMLGLAMNRVPNAWLADLVHLPQVLLPLWVLAGLAPKVTPRPAFLAAAGAMVFSAAWDAARVGLGGKWPLAEITSNLLLLVLCLWQFKGLMMQPEPKPASEQPAFWLLGAWILNSGIMPVFSPLHNLFLRQLSHDWILVPWLVRFILGLILNLVLARTYLCRTPSSS